MKGIRFLVISLFVLTTLSPAKAQEELIIDRIIAKVDNYIVLKSELERAYLDYLSRGEFNTGNAKCQILQQLVVNKMLVAKAEIDSVIVDDSEVSQNLRRRMDYMIQQIGSEDEIEKFYGKTVEQIEAELFDDIREQLTIQRMQSEITSKIKVTPSEVKRFFNGIPGDSLPYFSTEVTVGQIVNDPDPNQDQIDAVEQQLMSLRGRIISGESFGVLARQYSEDPGTANNGGELPFFRRGELAPEFEATALTMEKGEISLPVQTDFGIHIIELMEKRGNTFKSRHILMTPKPSVSDVQKARDELDSIRNLLITDDSVVFRNIAKDFSEDELTASTGGYFTSPDGATRIAVEALDPNIFFTIDTMDVGEISPPIQFNKPDGSVSFRILFYEDRVAPHQANLKDDYQKIAEATMNKKRSIKLSEWYENARNDVYIEIISDYDYCNLVN